MDIQLTNLEILKRVQHNKKNPQLLLAIED
jgi:hypothetical protein